MEGPSTTSNSAKSNENFDQPLSPTALVADGLLTLIHDYAKEEQSSDAEAFCSRVRGYRSRLGTSEGITENTARECIEECRAQFRRIHDLGSLRETEFAELISLLKDALTQGRDDTEAFHKKIFNSSDQFKGLSQLEDIREIKSQVVHLVRELRHAVLEKQQNDEQRKLGLSKRVEVLESKLEAARRQALTDPLTRVANRGGFDKTLRAWISQEKSFVLGIIDLDHFKSINDAHGHRVGDSVLVCAAQWIGERIRGKDLLARYGGDEFAVLMDGISLNVAQQKFDALLQELSSRSYVYTLDREKRSIKFTLSCGFTEFIVGDTAETLVQRADEALYDAKKLRNRVCTKRRTPVSGIFKKNY